MSRNDGHNGDEALRELDELVDRVCEKRLDAAGRTRLNALLRENISCRERYLEYVELHSTLWWSSADRSTRASETLQNEQSHDAADVVSEECATPHASRRSLLQWASRHPKGPAIAIAATLLIAALVVMGLVPVNEWIATSGKKDADEPDIRIKEKPEFVAKLTSWHNDQWAEGTRPPLRDPRLAIGKRLVLESGFAEIKYLAGATVVLEGPAEYWVVGRKNGQLESGKLLATVEEETAKGFSIDTPSARVEDLGTEFGVTVNRSGGSATTVLAGEVTVTPRVNGRLVFEQMLTLAAGQQVSISDTGQFVGAVRKLSTAELASLSLPTMPRVVEIFRDDFELPALEWHKDFESSGFYRGVPKDWQGIGTIFIAHENGSHFSRGEFTGQALTIGGGTRDVPIGSVSRHIGHAELSDTVVVEFVQATQRISLKTEVADVDVEFFDGDPTNDGTSIGKLTFVGGFERQGGFLRREMVALGEAANKAVDLHVRISKELRNARTGNIVIDDLRIITTDTNRKE